MDSKRNINLNIENKFLKSIIKLIYFFNFFSMQEMQKLYEVRKTVRFELVPQFKNPTKPKTSDNLDTDLKIFIEIYDKFLLNFENIVFKKYNKNELNPKLKIKYSWLKTYTKQEFYEIKDKIIKYNRKWMKVNNQVELNNKEIQFLFEKFQNWLENNKWLLLNIKDLWERSQENKSRKSDLAYYFHQILKRSNFEFIKELFNNNIQDTKWDDLINKTKDLTIKTTALLEWIEKTLLPSQSMWQVIEKASFNYYTVNKTPKNYEENITALKNDFHKWLFEFKDFKTNLIKFDISKIINIKSLIDVLDDEYFIPILHKDNQWNIRNKEIKKEIDYLNLEKGKNLDFLKIENAYKLMKEYKSEQKSAFLQFLSKWFTFEDLKNHREFDYHLSKDETKKMIIYLFDDISENNYKNIIEKTKKIWELSDEYNQTESKDLKEQITDLKKLRWTYFDVQNKTCVFTKYWSFCDEFKNIAMEFWRIKANIKSLEKEKIDAEKTNSWALILEKDNQKYLLTIPRITNQKLEWTETNLNKAKTYIDSLNAENSDLNLYKFESLTLRALDKLCFWKELNKNRHWEIKEEDNTFRKNIFSEILKYPKFFNEKQKLKDKFEFKKNKEDKELDEKFLLEFYQTVLTLESTKKQLIIKHFKDFDKFINSTFESLDEFETELKKTCYIKESINISSITKEKLINNFNAKLYKITSYDFKKNDKEVLAELKNKKTLDRENPKISTKIWLDFWSENNQNEKYPIRLNPEIKISFIEKDENFIKNNYGLPFNRKFYDRYLLTSTITQNALNKEINLNYKDKSEIIKTYESYNDDFNKNLKQNWLQYFYWLDRWENELVTLWLFDLSKEKNEEKWVWIEVWELNLKTNEKGWIAYKNLSYFLEDNEIFDKKTITSCFDLTSSKLIKDNIILNWDISSYLKLKEISAKRKIYEIISKSQNKSEKIVIDEFKRKIIVQWNEIKNEVLYYFDERYESIINIENIIKDLQKYLDKVKVDLSDNDEISIEKVNNLRDAICANMVWIITHLQDKYSWMMFFEDWNIKSKDDRVKNNSYNLTSRIEFKLLQKFSSLNQVPPTYKQAMTLQDENKIKQLWIIWYIDTSWTSTTCPCCPWKLYWHWKWPEFENAMCHDEQNKYWIMKNWKICDYHMKNNNYWFSFITSWDDLATYNIAKKWLEYLNDLSEHIEIYNSIKDRLDDNIFVDWNTVLKNL